MADPFAILAQNRFSIPDLISQDMGMKRQRLEDLYRAKQIEQADRQAQQEERRLSVLGKLLSKGGGQASGSAGSAPAPSGVGSPQAPAFPGEPVRPDAASVPSGSPLSPETIADQPGAGGPLVAGNIDLHNRPKVSNADGSYSTVRSISIGTDQGEVLIPTVSDDGRVMSNEEAIQNFKRTGKHLGIFKTPQEATAYAERLHNEQASEYGAAPMSGGSSAPTLNQEALAELMVIDPDTALKIQKSFADADEATRKAAEGKYAVLGSVAMHLTSFPPNARKAALQQLAPRLMAAGWSAEELNQADLSDAGLQGYAAVSMDVKSIMDQTAKDRAFAETQRHNRVSEGQGAARIGVAQGALSLAKQREGRVASGKGGEADNSDLNYLLDQ